MEADRVRDRAVPGSVLIVEDHRPTAEDLARALAREFDCVLASRGEEALAHARSREIAVALVDLDLGTGMNGFDVIAGLRRIDPRTAIVIVTGDDSDESVRRASELEIQDYITKSIGAGELRAAVRRSLILRRAAERLGRLESEQRESRGSLVAESAAMKRVLSEIEKAARHVAPVLITGPIGAGKTVVASEIHERSRRGRPFERLHCATLDTGDLADTQIFGSEPGAFTGATKRTIGAFERAEDGTILLDDIDCLPVRIQAKLLQPIEERILRRLPGTVQVAVRCRILVTTSRDLDALVRMGSFREDLLGRLRGAPEIRVPGIEERAEDIPGLARDFVRRAAIESGLRPPKIPDDFMDVLSRRRWTDARQLLNALRSMVGSCAGDTLEESALEDLPAERPDADPAGRAGAPESGGPGGATTALTGSLRSMTCEHRWRVACEALRVSGGDKKTAAALLEITITRLNQILKSGPTQKN